MTVEEKLLLDSYRAISDKHVQESILTIAQNVTRQSEQTFFDHQNKSAPSGLSRRGVSYSMPEKGLFVLGG